MVDGFLMFFVNEFICLLTQILDDLSILLKKTSRDHEVNTCPSLCDLKHGWKTFGAILFAIFYNRDIVEMGWITKNHEKV